MTRILLSDDHEIVRAGLKLYINSILTDCIIDEAWNEESTISRMKENQYDLIILDINMPDTDSFGLMNNILGIQSKMKILVFSMNEDVYAKRFLRLGAKGYLTKTSAVSELGIAIKTILNGRIYISQSLIESITEQTPGKRSSANPFEKLSSREFEIVQYLLLGKSSAEIAATLQLKAPTIATFKSRIFTKLNCKNLVEVGTLARIYKIIT